MACFSTSQAHAECANGHSYDITLRFQNLRWSMYPYMYLSSVQYYVMCYYVK
jgi:hypothetical protein